MEAPDVAMKTFQCPSQQRRSKSMRRERQGDLFCPVQPQDGRQPYGALKFRGADACVGGVAGGLEMQL